MSNYYDVVSQKYSISKVELVPNHNGAYIA